MLTTIQLVSFSHALSWCHSAMHGHPTRPALHLLCQDLLVQCHMLLVLGASLVILPLRDAVQPHFTFRAIDIAAVFVDGAAVADYAAMCCHRSRRRCRRGPRAARPYPARRRRHPGRHPRCRYRRRRHHCRSSRCTPELR